MNLEDLRKRLFDELDKLNNADLSNKELLRGAIDHAQAVTNVADTILNSARIELDFMKLMERNRPLTPFVHDDEAQTKKEIERGIRLAKEAGKAWHNNTPEKVHALNAGGGLGGMEKTA